MNSEHRWLWMVARFWGGVLLYVTTLVASLINGYNSGEFAALNIVVPVLLLFIVVSIAALSWKNGKRDES